MRVLWILTPCGFLLIFCWAAFLLPVFILQIGVAFMAPMTFLFFLEIYERSMHS